MVYSTPYVFETKVIYIYRTPKYDKKRAITEKTAEKPCARPHTSKYLTSNEKIFASLDLQRSMYETTPAPPYARTVITPARFIGICKAPLAVSMALSAVFPTLGTIPAHCEAFPVRLIHDVITQKGRQATASLRPPASIYISL